MSLQKYTEIENGARFPVKNSLKMNMWFLCKAGK